MSIAYDEEDVRFDNGEIRLAGSFMIPQVGAPHPAVIFIHGSGFSDRWNPWYRSIAEHLLRSGIAVLLPDKRGSGQSEGDWRRADLHDLAGDTLAASQYVRVRSEVDRDQIGLLGVSQGGWIAPMVADRSEEIAFIVVVSGSAVTPARNLAHEVRQSFYQLGLPAGLSRLVYPLSSLLVQFRWRKWWDVHRFDPLPIWERLRVPALFLNGSDDENVPVSESLFRLEEASRRRAGEAIATQVFAGSGHGLFAPGTEEIRQDFLDLLVEWITEHGSITRATH